MIGEILLRPAGWLLFAVFGIQVLFFVGFILWMIWTASIRPRLIPAAEIERVADDIIASYPPPGTRGLRSPPARVV